MRIKPTLAPSRQGKKQLMVFLEPSFAGRVRSRAGIENLTMQEFLAKAMNRALRDRRRRQVFPVARQRFLVRKVAVASPRDPEKTSLGRGGRASLSGWYPADCVEYANGVAEEFGLTLQEMAEKGLRALMDVESASRRDCPESGAR